MPAIGTVTALSRPALLAVSVFGLLIAATIALWSYYGTTVFFEMVRAGWMACF
jgi:hypothetical protein